MKSALVLPGWFRKAKGKSAVSVLNAKQISSFLVPRGELLPPDLLRAG